jgi:hypothetical protein
MRMALPFLFVRTALQSGSMGEYLVIAFRAGLETGPHEKRGLETGPHEYLRGVLIFRIWALFRR